MNLFNYPDPLLKEETFFFDPQRLVSIILCSIIVNFFSYLLFYISKTFSDSI